LADAAGATVLRREGGGYGAAIKLAARHARGELLALIDADGSYPEAVLPDLVEQVRRGARQAIGARPGFSGAESRARSAVKALFRTAVARLGGFVAPDLNSGLRVLRTADVLRLSPLLPDRFSASTTLTLRLASEGHRVVFVPIEYLPRGGRSKWRPVRDTWRMGRVVLRGIGWLRVARSRKTRLLPEGELREGEG
jgi:hypothetical protein